MSSPHATIHISRNASTSHAHTKDTRTRTHARANEVFTSNQSHVPVASISHRVWKCLFLFQSKTATCIPPGHTCHRARRKPKSEACNTEKLEQPVVPDQIARVTCAHIRCRIADEARTNEHETKQHCRQRRREKKNAGVNTGEYAAVQSLLLSPSSVAMCWKTSGVTFTTTAEIVQLVVSARDSKDATRKCRHSFHFTGRAWPQPAQSQRRTR